MKYTLHLTETLASGESETKNLTLLDSICKTEYVKVQVYDDARYDFVTEFDSPNLFRVEKFVVEVNGETISDTFEIQSKENEPLRVASIVKRGVKAFATCYDYCQITIEAVIDKKEYRLVSEEIICLNRAFFGKNIKNMLSYLVNLKSKEIDEAVFRTKDTKLFAIDEYSEDRSINNEVTKESLLRYVKDTTSYFEKHYIEFKAKPHQTIRQKASVISASRAKRISHQDIEWLAKNSENMVKVETRTGVKFGKSYYMPVMIKSLDRVISFNTYENRALISFLQTMHFRVRKVIDSISQINDVEEENISRLSNFEDKDYKIASLELKRWNIEGNKELLKEYELQERRLKRLIRSYEELFGIHGEMSKATPKRTKVFSQIGHYKQAYNLMLRWKNVDLSFNKYVAVNNIRSVSEIYEYFCLVKLIEMLTNHGFEIESLPVKDASYEYEEDSKYKQKQKTVANTYLLTNKDFIVKLYYEPKIYSYHSDKNNNITIYRTDAPSKNYYTPDYLLTFLKKDSDSIRHIIIDAKYKGTNDAYVSLTTDIMKKYYLDVGCQGENEKIAMVWVINGKHTSRDDEYHLERYQKSSLLNRFALTPSFGVCGLTSQDNELDELYKEISLQVGC